MRELSITQSITLDGVIDTAEGWFDPASEVDEYRLFVCPVVLGRGRRLLADATSAPRRQLAETRPLRSGAALLRYRATGDRSGPA
jgi:dihydrofolate reductase